MAVRFVVRVTMLMTVFMTLFAGMLMGVIVAVIVTMCRIGNVRINQFAARVGRMIELFLQPVHHAIQSHAVAQIRKNKRPFATHAA